MGLSREILGNIMTKKNIGMRELASIVGWTYFKVYGRMNNSEIKSDEFIFLMNAVGYSVSILNPDGVQSVISDCGTEEDSFCGATRNTIESIIKAGNYKKIDIARAAKMTLNHFMHKIERDSFRLEEFIEILTTYNFKLVVTNQKTGEVEYISDNWESEKNSLDRAETADIIRSSLKSVGVTQTAVADYFGITLSQLNQKIRKNTMLADDFFDMMVFAGMEISITKQGEQIIDITKLFKRNEYGSNEIVIALMEREELTKASLCKKVGWDTNQLNQRLTKRSIRAGDFLGLIGILGYEFEYKSAN